MTPFQSCFACICTQVDEGDFFWAKNSRQQFPKMAEDVDAQLKAYREAIDELNRKTGANMSAEMGADKLQQVQSALV